MMVEIIQPDNLLDISSHVLNKDGKLKLLTAKEWQKYPWNDFRVFCHTYARYGIPTEEAIIFLNELIDGRSAIEIGAGAGDFGHYLNVKMTDSKIQDDPIVKEHYSAAMQPTIKYPNDVEKIDALEAVQKYRPQVVFASWITSYHPHETTFGSSPFGVREKEILDLVETFIIFGNHDMHWDKPIMKFRHDEYYFDWMVSRGKNKENNRIWIWNKDV